MFEGVGKDRMDAMDSELRDGSPPEGLDATEIVVLHDPETDQALVIVFFETEDDYKRGDESWRDAGRRHAGPPGIG